MSFKSIPNEVYPIQGGDPSKASFMHLQRMQANQAAMSRKFSGGRSRSRRYRGGSSTISPALSSSTISPALITIPSFPSGGGINVSPFDANSASLNSNRTLISGLSQAQNDCYATRTCALVGGRRHKYRRYKSSKSRRHKSRRHKSRRNKSRKTRTK